MFPTLHAVQYHDANIPAMGNIYYLVKKVVYVLLSYQTILNHKGLFALCIKLSKEMNTVIGNSEKEDCFSDEETR